jgi:hypothetical protein
MNIFFTVDFLAHKRFISTFYKNRNSISRLKKKNCLFKYKFLIELIDTLQFKAYTLVSLKPSLTD